MRGSGRHRASRAFSPPSLPVGSHLVTVAAERWTAPTAVMRFGLVGEPEYAGLILAAFHESEVGRRQEVSGSFRDRPQNPRGRVLPPDPVDRRRARLVPHEPGMALRLGQKTVEDRRIPSPPGPSFLDQRPDALPQRSRGIHEGHRRRVRAESSDGESGSFEPTQHVLVALHEVHQLAIHPHPGVQEIQRRMTCQEQGAGFCARSRAWTSHGPHHRIAGIEPKHLVTRDVLLDK